MVVYRQHQQAYERPAGEVFGKGLYLYFFLHFLLALVARQYQAVSTLHALATGLVGLLWALKYRKPDRIAYISAYIVGAEVFWRMTQAAVFYEYGKYLLCLILLISIVRTRSTRFTLPAALYFLLMIPGLFIAYDEFANFDDIRKLISFNLSGPLSLCISLIFCASLKLDSNKLINIFISLIMPIVCVFTAAFISTFTAQDLYFTSDSNFVTSGGFGPNQVSGVLGLGALMVFLLLIYIKPGFKKSIPMILMMIGFMVQSALTFSRGGLYIMAASILVSAFFYLRSMRNFIRFVLVVGVLALIATFVIFPFLESFTSGQFSQRFSETTMSGREEKVESDIEIFMDNILLGVGVGQSRKIQEEMTIGDSIIAHNEFTRMLSEHGMLGVVSLLTLGIIFLKHFTTLQDSTNKAFCMAMLIWSSGYMFANAMRIAAPGFIFGLSFAFINFDVWEYVARNYKDVRRAGWRMERKERVGAHS